MSYDICFQQHFPVRFRENFIANKTGISNLQEIINYIADDLPIREFKPIARMLGLNELDFEQLEAR